MDVFTLTLTLSLKGEGIAELRNSYNYCPPPGMAADWDPDVAML